MKRALGAGGGGGTQYQWQEIGYVQEYHPVSKENGNQISYC